MFDDLDQIFHQVSGSLSDDMKHYFFKMLPQNNKIEQILHLEKPSEVPESPRRLRKPVETLSHVEEVGLDDVVFDMDWAFNVVLPMLKLGDVSYLVGEMLLDSAHYLFSREPLIMDLDFPEPIETIIVGDIHGQFSDLVEIFEKFGRPGLTRRYIFNGDIVDRGPRSVACWLFLCALKTAGPDFLYVTRGNHETRTVSIVHSSFAHECFDSYSQKFYLSCQNVFDELPISYTLNKSIFITHGGLPKHLCLERLRKMSKSRFHSTFDQETVMALLWNDPAEILGYTKNARGPNVFSFGPDVTEKFLKKHNLSLLIRSHECKIFGHQYSHNSKCLTVFSCPDYQNWGNSGAVAIVNYKGEVEIEQF